MDKWRFVQAYINYFFGTSPRILDYIAVEGILRYAVSGLSNKTIANKLELEEEILVEILSDFLLFDGWKEDLDFSPIFFYNKNYGVFFLYERDVLSISSATDENTIKESYNVCSIYHMIVKETSNE